MIGKPYEHGDFLCIKSHRKPNWGKFYYFEKDKIYTLYYSENHMEWRTCFDIGGYCSWNDIDKYFRKPTPQELRKIKLQKLNNKYV